MASSPSGGWPLDSSYVTKYTFRVCNEQQRRETGCNWPCFIVKVKVLADCGSHKHDDSNDDDDNSVHNNKYLFVPSLPATHPPGPYTERRRELYKCFM